jgi:hypothetical protein
MLGEDFTAFWAAYPRRVGKLDALKAYEKARKLDSAENILAGVAKYKRHLPDEARFICHPATFLNKGRWMDEYEVVVEQPERVDWFDECKAIHGGECGLNQQRHAQRKWADAYRDRESA